MSIGCPRIKGLYDADYQSRIGFDRQPVTERQRDHRFFDYALVVTEGPFHSNVSREPRRAERFFDILRTRYLSFLSPNAL